MTPLALVTATRWEFRALCRALPAHELVRESGRRWARGRCGPTDVLIVQTGVGPDRARAAMTDALAAHPAAAVLSLGFGGALTAAAVGDLLIATEVVVEPGTGADGVASATCAAALVDRAERIAREGGWGACRGRLLAVPAVVVSADEKARLGASTGAIGVDMESGAIGAVAARHGVPFLAVRAVSDRLDESLPEAFNGILTPGRRVQAGLDLVLRPSSWVALARLRRHTGIAARRLTAFTVAFLHSTA